ncbi:MAG: ComEC/Rec2 family competence protein [Rhizobiaceae bacterium]|nr:ComEC/Rec2 family competence protein [Rhizobiaceae bacterium]
MRRSASSATQNDGSDGASALARTDDAGQGAGFRHGVASFGSGLINALRREERQGQAVLWLPVAMALGAAFWFSADSDILLLPVALLFAATATTFGLLSEKPRLRVAALFAAGFLVAMLAAQLETARRDTILLDSDVTTRIRGTVIARDIDYRGLWRYTIELHQTSDPQIGRPPQRVRLITRSSHQPIRPGDGIAGLARLQPPSGPALPGGYDFAFYAFFNGLGAYGFFLGAPEPSMDGAAQVSMTQTIGLHLARIREEITRRIRNVLSGDTAGFASALTVADRRAMSPATVDALRESGLAHVLAISGLHMALVSGTLFFFLRVCFSFFPPLVQAFPVKKIAAAAALLVATFYLLISGASISTQRAWIMLAIMLVAVVLDRPALTMRNVALAAIIIIMVTPSAVMGPGFQMSFAATVALIATYAHWNLLGNQQAGSAAAGLGVDNAPASGLLRLIVVFLFGLAMTSLVAGLATAPFATYHFHRVASLGLLANLAAMPIVTFIVMPAGLIALLAMPLGLEHWPLVAMGQGLDWVIAIAQYVQGLGGVLVVGRVQSLQFASLVTGFLILALMKTPIRLTGAAILLAGLLVPVIAVGPSDLELVVSEDGRLIAFVRENALATNRRRPSKFIFQQWQGALGRAAQIKPEILPAPDAERSLEDNVSAIAWNSKAVTCVKSAYCNGLTRSGQRVMIVEDLLYLGAACDRADIVITPAKINMERCYSGAMLMTGRMLRQSGALEIHADSKTRALTVRSAVGQTDRPWTVHRSYDWRSRSFERNAVDWLTK